MSRKCSHHDIELLKIQWGFKECDITIDKILPKKGTIATISIFLETNQGTHAY